MPASSGSRLRASGTRPVVGLIDAMPQQWAGLRSEPPMSLPIPSGLMPLAIAAASPPLDPPGVTRGSHGLTVAPCSCESVWIRRPKSGRFVRPRTTAPAPRSRSTAGASLVATAPARARTPSVVGVADDVDVLLDRHRDAVQQPERPSLVDRAVGGAGRPERLLGQHPDHRVQPRVDLRDAVQVGLRQLDGRDLPGRDPPGHLRRRQRPEAAVLADTCLHHDAPRVASPRAPPTRDPVAARSAAPTDAP